VTGGLPKMLLPMMSCCGGDPQLTHLAIHK
jgi:hypothetical protein